MIFWILKFIPNGCQRTKILCAWVSRFISYYKSAWQHFLIGRQKRIKEEKEFTISANSWASEGNIEFTKNKEGEDKVAAEGTSAMKVENRNLTIPQTGGIGSLIFVVAGLAIMAGAYAAYRKSQARA